MKPAGTAPTVSKVTRVLTALIALALAGCTNMGLVSGAAGEAAPNTFKCFTGEFHGTYTASDVAGGVIIVPEGMDPAALSPEQVRAYAEILGCSR